MDFRPDRLMGFMEVKRLSDLSHTKHLKVFPRVAISTQQQQALQIQDPVFTVLEVSQVELDRLRPKPASWQERGQNGLYGIQRRFSNGRPNNRSPIRTTSNV